MRCFSMRLCSAIRMKQQRRWNRLNAQWNLAGLADGVWQRIFAEKPEVFTKEAKRAWLDQAEGVSLGSDAFFPFSDNIERAAKSGVKYIAEPGGSVRDSDVIEACDMYNMTMAFTGIRLFHH